MVQINSMYLATRLHLPVFLIKQTYHQHCAEEAEAEIAEMRHSGLQKEVLKLYRHCLRETRKKPEATRAHFEGFARAEFAKNVNIDRRDFGAIEFLLRKGRRQLDRYSAPGIKDIR